MANELDKRIQALPQELQDHILDYLISPPVHTKIAAKKHQLPIGFFINRKQRARTAKIYYGNNTFRFSEDCKQVSYGEPDGYPSVGEWLAVVDEGHRGLLKEVVFVVVACEGCVSERMLGSCFRMAKDWKRKFVEGFALEGGVIRLVGGDAE